jgi:hypothetical protein
MFTFHRQAVWGGKLWSNKLRFSTAATQIDVLFRIALRSNIISILL